MVDPESGSRRVRKRGRDALEGEDEDEGEGDREGDAASAPMFHIGTAAARVGLSLRTIRHWDEVGLVQPSGRSAGGFRLYTARDIERLAFVMKLKPLEFRLEEMRDLLMTWDHLTVGGDDEAGAALVDHLDGYAIVAAQRCERLREQLSAAEGIAEQLRADVDRARKRTLRDR